MEISSRWVKNARVITLSGQFDNSEWPICEAAFVAAQIAQRRHIILKLGELACSNRFLIEKLFLTYLQLRKRGIRLSLVNPQGAIREKFERTNIPSLVDYYADEYQALAAA